MIAKASQSVTSGQSAKSTQSDQPIQSDRIPITHEERFSDAELFSMFNMDRKSPGASDVVTYPFWRVSTANVNDAAEFDEDDMPRRTTSSTVRVGKLRDSSLAQISKFPPGSRERIEALREFYSASRGRRKSAAKEGKRSAGSAIGCGRRRKSFAEHARSIGDLFASVEHRRLVFDEFDAEGLPDAPFEHCDATVKGWDREVEVRDGDVDGEDVGG